MCSSDLAADDPVTDGASGVDVDKSDPDGKELPAAGVQIGRASCRERV